jgi:fatty-acyl-CoA synthase
MSGSPVFPARPDPLRFWRHQAPDRVALVDRSRGGRYTYAELDAGADRWAAVLRGLGVRRGDLVAALAGNRREMVEAFHACGRIGAALLPLNWRLSAAELAPIMADARPAVLLGEGRFRALAEGAIPSGGEVRWMDLDHDAPPLLARARNVQPDAEVGPEDAALVLYTSGSTGRPKGAVLPHRQVHWNAVATTTGWELGHADVAPVSTPFFHTGGWNVFATPLWHRGGTAVLFDGFDADAFLDGLAEERCTVAMVVPTQLVMLSERPGWGRALPSLRFLISGGAPCPSSLAERTREAGYRFREGYGLTECGPNCFAISDDEAVRRPGSVGRPVPYLGMRLDAGGGREAEPGEAGELLLRGPQMFAGYLRDPERTAEALTPDGWLRTGDLARRDADGFFSICGRRKEMYISGGENVFPGEVEAALADCPGVAEAVVVGVPDPRWGEVGRAFVVARTGAAVREEAVIDHARARLARYKVPRSVIVLPQIPRLGSGKPDRRALAAMEVEVSV